MGEEQIIRVRGEGGHEFDLDLAKNPWAVKQIEVGTLTVIETADPEKPKRGRGRGKDVELAPEPIEEAAEEPVSNPEPDAPDQEV